MDNDETESFAVTTAERQMIEPLRYDENITLTIAKDGDRWHVRLEDHDSGVLGDGHGATFTHAWDDVVDPRLRQSAAM